ncbi:MAG: hypothetical protein WBY44_05510 [Bryobacteraceae bacterium]|jgi:hypothetical protein
MHLNNRTITTKRRGALLSLTFILLALANQTLAHGGFDHVIGTIVRVANNVLTVKTAKGNVDVSLNDKTEITKSDQKAVLADLKPGARVVVDVPEHSKVKIAHSVKIGVSTAADTHTHSPQD